MEIDVLFEDNHIIAINKKPSQLVQGDKTNDEPLSEMVKKYIKLKYNKPGEVFIGVVHRLDRPVSGIVLFAKTSKALSRLNELFRTKNIQKTYWAVVKNAPKKTQDTLVNFLIKDEKTNKSRAFNEERKNALRSELSYKTIGKTDNYYLLEVLPITGRHHQIRVQLAHMGCPIKGDLKYGFDRSNKDASIHLHARKIEFIHPVKNEKIIIEATPPNDPVWNACASLIDDK
jgi:23S rRNA pseudouridine1911/1915/1917 synthase